MLKRKKQLQFATPNALLAKLHVLLATAPA
jgi:hypothetical protein